MSVLCFHLQMKLRELFIPQQNVLIHWNKIKYILNSTVNLHFQ